MSEGVLYNVEDGGAPPPDNTPAPPEPAAEAVPAAQEPAAQPEAAPEVEVDGQRMVPLPALLALREENKALKEKASQFDQIAGEWNNARPYIDFLRANPDLLKPRQQEPAPAAQAPEDDPKLVQLARTLDLYTPEGKPDAKRAQQLREAMREESRTVVQDEVRPLHEQTVQQRAQANLQNALNVDLNGMKPNPQVLQHIWRTTDPKVLATDQGAAAAVLMAMGIGNIQAPSQAPAIQPPAQAPVVTEPSGGRNLNRPAVSDFEEKALRVRGLDLKKYGEYTRNFVPGRTNQLED